MPSTTHVAIYGPSVQRHAPHGKLHLGNYWAPSPLGQAADQYDCYSSSRLHADHDEYADLQTLRHTLEVALDFSARPSIARAIEPSSEEEVERYLKSIWARCLKGRASRWSGVQVG